MADFEEVRIGGAGDQAAPVRPAREPGCSMLSGADSVGVVLAIADRGFFHICDLAECARGQGEPPVVHDGFVRYRQRPARERFVDEDRAAGDEIADRHLDETVARYVKSLVAGEGRRDVAVFEGHDFQVAMHEHGKRGIARFGLAHELHLALDLVLEPDVVLVAEHQVGRFQSEFRRTVERRLHQQGETRAGPYIGLRLRQQVKAVGVAVGIFLKQAPAAVARAVVARHDDEVLPGLAQQGIELLGEKAFAVVSRKQYGQRGIHGLLQLPVVADAGADVLPVFRPLRGTDQQPDRLQGEADDVADFPADGRITPGVQMNAVAAGIVGP